ncbi:sodium/potassium/calcium exchanger 2 isoform X4 [Ambystoma mexicanum]|uniref:sodium/potassium/calcium exchanger 2 isoform X4 n=1 Tax=Ambystoma mexicanum TaxID=8296 RepID=UPI0037E94789
MSLGNTADSSPDGLHSKERLMSCKRRHQFVRKKLKAARILGLLLSVVAISTFSFSVSAFVNLEPHSPELTASLASRQAVHWHQRNLLDLVKQTQNGSPDGVSPLNPEPENSNKTEEVHSSKGDYPEDIFSLADRRRGAVVLHIFGMIYMFIALAIVCDEFFVPSLTVITEKLAISDDVAGATFMAAGGSAPELFTSLIGVFISHSNVGIGTIVGSAVFNILFVIGMCALFSREVLNLTWWPLFRDVSFYILGLLMLISFFLDNFIHWWESLLLLSVYITYVTFMKFNVQVEDLVKRKLHWNKVAKVTAADPEAKEHREHPNILVLRGENGGHRTIPQHEGVEMETAELKETWLENRTSPTKPANEGNREETTLMPANEGNREETTLMAKPRLQRGGSSASLHNSLMRNSIFQLMIHTLDPLSEGRFREKASILHKMAKKKCQVEDSERLNGAANYMEKTELPNTTNVEVEITPPKESPGQVQNGNLSHTAEGGDNQGAEADMENEEEDTPLSLAWPSNSRKKAFYLAVLPIIFPLWITLPDVRNPSSRKYFPITFFGSISWIAIFSYLMVWWAHQVGETVGITEEIMGLTILAAGTSIPDLITSVIVARKGLGDMAVSSSVGSNIFDITVGLPLPWLLFSAFHRLEPIPVSSNGLFCAIVLLFIMLLFVIISIAVCKWRMNKFLGFTMFGLYLVFLVISVLLEDRIIMCPVSI